MILPDMPNLATIAFLQHQAEEELELQARVLKARELDAGYFDSDLAAQTVKYMIGSEEEQLQGVNLMTIVLRTITRRIDVQGFKASPVTPDGADPTPEQQAQADAFARWIDTVWDFNEMDTLQNDVHRLAERDGECFVIVDYDQAVERPHAPGQFGMPRFFVHERYTSAEVSFGDAVGSNEGCKAHYRNNDYRQPLEMVSKRWIETIYEGEEEVQRQRMTLYIAKQPLTPARIEKYVIGDSGEWEQFNDQVFDANGNEIPQTWPIWWTVGGQETGISLPLPVIHFRNEEMSPITQRLWGLQDAMDHAFSSLMGGVMLTGQQVLKFFGFYPTNDGKAVAADGSNLLRVGPRTMIGAPDKKPGDASLDPIQPGDLTPIINAMDKIAIYCSFVAGLPINNFVLSKAVASSSTLRQGEADLVAHVYALQRLFGRSWIRVLMLAKKLAEIYGQPPETFEPASIQTIWAPAETVNIEGLNATAIAKKNTGVPEEEIWRSEWGYDENQVAAMMAAKEQAESGEETTTSNAGTSAIS